MRQPTLRLDTIDAAAGEEPQIDAAVFDAKMAQVPSAEAQARCQLAGPRDAADRQHWPSLEVMWELSRVRAHWHRAQMTGPCPQLADLHAYHSRTTATASSTT